jgi:hypothetical protein
LLLPINRGEQSCPAEKKPPVWLPGIVGGRIAYLSNTSVARSQMRLLLALLLLGTIGFEQH